MADGNAGRHVRLGMVAGGEGAAIGGVHRVAARLDDGFDLLAGALSSTPERSARSAAVLGLDPSRSSADFATMAEAGRRRRFVGAGVDPAVRSRRSRGTPFRRGRAA